MRFKKIITIFLMTVLLAGSAANSALAAVNEDVKSPAIDAKSAIVYSVTTDEVLFTKNADKRVQPWSTTKLMTALIVAEEMDLDQTVTVSSKAAALGGSTMNLVAGEKLSVKDLMYGLLIESGNDAAMALAQAYDGGLTKFVARMNARAEELGCTGTHFVNPNGLKAKNHYTTASDYLKIAKAAFANDTVYQIGGTKVYHVKKTNKSAARMLETHLDLLEDEDSGVVSGKTGYWENDDCSIVLMYDKAGLQLILLQFGANYETRADDDELLLKFARKKIVTVNATNPDEAVGKVRVKYGAHTAVDSYPKDVVLAYPKDGTDKKISFQAKYNKTVEAPLQAGDEVGTVDVYCDGKKVGTTALLVKEDVEKGWILSRFYISNNATIAIGVILVLLLIILVFLRSRFRGRKVPAGKHWKR